MNGATSGELSTCGCCEGVRDRIPARIANRPGLGEIGYRVGDYHQFKQSLLAGLTDGEREQLGGLLTRDDDDFAIGLIDAWAMVGDVLTFYVERTAQEHYLATATERRSVADLVHLIGYRPRSGVAASTALAFTLEASPLPPRQAPPGAPERVPIATGTRVQSIPGPDERPQTFETIEDLEALVAWNRLTPRLTWLRHPRDTDTAAYLSGSALNLGPGDVLIFVAEAPSTGPRPWAWGRVTAVASHAETNRTLVAWDRPLDGLGPPPASDDPGPLVQIFVLRQRASLFGYNAPDPRLFTIDVVKQLGSALLCKSGTAIVACSNTVTTVVRWDFTLFNLAVIDLDSVVPGLKPIGWALLSNPNFSGVSNPTLIELTGVSERSRSGYAISARVTSLEAARTDGGAEAFPEFGGEHTRETAVLLGSEELPLAETPLDTPIDRDTIPIVADVAIEPLPRPRKVALRGRRQRLQVPDSASEGARTLIEDGNGEHELESGEQVLLLGYRTDASQLPNKVFWRLQTLDGITGEIEEQFADDLDHVSSQPDDEVIAEVANVESVAQEPDTKIATLTLTQALTNVYDRPTVEIFGNVAAATHGESIRGEVLGSGDAARPYQQFALDKGPLTYVSAATPSGGTSTLEVQVNAVEWDEATTFFGASPRDRVYVTAVAETGETAVRFGDGVNGARLPTGFENIRATYRTGIGAAGNLDPDRLTLLMTRPLGVKAVNNPVPASGGQEAETTDDARGSAPLTVLTLDRIVSLPDYEDFARAFAGVAKAAAVDTWDGARRGVLLTVAGIDGAELAPGMATYDNLVAAIAKAGNPRLDVQVRSYRPKPFHVTASLLVETGHDPEIVLAQARTVWLARFSFAARAFGQLVSLSEVTTALQNVLGVVAVDVNQLYKEGEAALLNPYLTADAPKPGGPPDAQGAELLTLAPDSLAKVTEQP